MDVTEFQSADEYERALNAYLAHANGYYPVKFALGEIDLEDQEYQDYLYVRDHRDLLVSQARHYEMTHDPLMPPPPPPTMASRSLIAPQQPPSGHVPILLVLCVCAFAFGLATAGGFWLVCLIGGSLWGIGHWLQKHG